MRGYIASRQAYNGNGSEADATMAKIHSQPERAATMACDRFERLVQDAIRRIYGEHPKCIDRRGP
jgi:hypothetical protein